ncbi:SPV138 N1R/p28-like host range RING finger protein [Swinepox virus]|uniref:Host range factor p28 n=1 Tax=Swinepox virus (strain Swine/Nebraska/17077-99/1999) TaxID=300880 RepID=Q8V3F8_SWPV1|nr:N1R/p28-like protein [Swinepox virus]AAL69877.1 SPV138 N1R/p28-like host range RING finger protein [Swinepox virus]UED36610.1 N1R/p28-like protein [Swinepox virus]UED36759.1 N1R/p28-like protein [Swinepox virus]UUA44328.1 SPV138 [Swinepox virus]
MNIEISVKHYPRGFKILRNNICPNIILTTKENYINITRLCNGQKKTFSRWKCLATNARIIDNISLEENICVKDLSFRIYSCNLTKSVHGIFIHPKLLKPFLDWISTEYSNDVISVINKHDKNILGQELCNKKMSYTNMEQEETMFKAICKKKQKQYKYFLSNIPSVLQEYENVYNDSIDKECSICMEIVYEKKMKSKFFGILSHCNHIFCIDCINEWRKQRNTCPLCRVTFSSIIKTRFFSREVIS